MRLAEGADGVVIDARLARRRSDRDGAEGTEHEQRGMHEGHGFLRPANSMSFNAITEVFLGECLGGRYEPIGEKIEGSSVEVPVGFKWFVDGLQDGSCVFGGEESAGASFLRRDGSVWTTDKDGILLCLLASEILAVTGKDPGEHYQDLVTRFGNPVYERVDAPANREEKARLAALSTEQVKVETMASEMITAKLTHAPANGAAIGGIKV